MKRLLQLGKMPYAYLQASHKYVFVQGWTLAHKVESIPCICDTESTSLLLLILRMFLHRRGRRRHLDLIPQTAYTQIVFPQQIITIVRRVFTFFANCRRAFSNFSCSFAFISGMNVLLVSTVRGLHSINSGRSRCRWQMASCWLDSCRNFDHWISRVICCLMRRCKQMLKENVRIFANNVCLAVANSLLKN